MTFEARFYRRLWLFGVVLRPADRRAVAAFLGGLELFALGYSWGLRSLIIDRPAKQRTATRWPYAGPSIRIHTGLEDAGDLIADLEAASRAQNAARWARGQAGNGEQDAGGTTMADRPAVGCEGPPKSRRHRKAAHDGGGTAICSGVREKRGRRRPE
jgi:hypothetical protein